MWPASQLDLVGKLTGQHCTGLFAAGGGGGSDRAADSAAVAVEHGDI